MSSLNRIFPSCDGRELEKGDDMDQWDQWVTPCCVYFGWEEVVGSFFGETDLLLELMKCWKMRIC